MKLQLSYILCAMSMLECRSFSYLLAPTLHSVRQHFSQQLMRSTTGIPDIRDEDHFSSELMNSSDGDFATSDKKNGIIESGHRNLRMIACFLLSTGFLSLNPVAAFAEAPQPTNQMEYYVPLDKTEELASSSFPSLIPSKQIKTSTIYSLSSSTSLSLSNAVLQKPEIEIGIQNFQVGDVQRQVNMPGNVREMIAKSASNIPGYYTRAIRVISPISHFSIRLISLSYYFHFFYIRVIRPFSNFSLLTPV